MELRRTGSAITIYSNPLGARLAWTVFAFVFGFLVVCSGFEDFFGSDSGIYVRTEEHTGKQTHYYCIVQASDGGERRLNGAIHSTNWPPGTPVEKAPGNARIHRLPIGTAVPTDPSWFKYGTDDLETACVVLAIGATVFCFVMSFVWGRTVFDLTRRTFRYHYFVFPCWSIGSFEHTFAEVRRVLVNAVRVKSGVEHELRLMLDHYAEYKVGGSENLRGVEDIVAELTPLMPNLVNPDQVFQVVPVFRAPQPLCAPVGSVVVTRQDGVCQICGTGGGERWVRCAKCETPHHEDCWSYTGTCSTYGCGEVRYVREERA